MKTILDILNEINTQTKEIPVTELPSQGLFYPCDFKISIRKASIDDIYEYNSNFEDAAITILSLVHNMIRKCVILEKYTFEDIKSVDMFYLIFEISKFTMNRNIQVNFYDKLERESFDLIINKDTFNYFDYKEINATYNPITRELERDGYKFCVPSYGVEICLIDYITNIDYSEFNSDFIFFVGNKRLLTKDEITNLKIIFNEELNENEVQKINDIVVDFKNLITYSLKYNGKKYDLEFKVKFAELFI